MAQAGFLEDNQNRRYPFEGPDRPTFTIDTTSFEIPDAAIVDCGALLYPGSGFDATLHAFALTALGVIDDALVLRVACAAPGLPGPLELTASLTATVTPYTTLRGLLEDGDGRPLMEVHVTLGLGALLDATFLPGNVLWDVTGGVLEPALAQDLTGRRLDCVSLANLPRTRAIAPAECPPYPVESHPGVARVVARGLQGTLRVLDGHGITVTHADRGNALILTARPGSGQGWPCGEIPRYPDEVPPLGSRLLSGGPACVEAVRSIGGAVGPDLTIVAGRGFRLRPVPDREHALELACELTLPGICPEDMISDDEGWDSSSSSTGA